ncbi:stationary phase growth adaptation protein [Caballeronia arvi]|uniref:Stationary phase growth adaptation protein n=1 Tax=Caballeronia arvi TaxID=1777135 RepID=A0A158JCX3_9BURK|nr:hypothetical protein [Caballeronia arvi]SAL66732.1 stationary phase growth adaptation protein [Caballeronia arvi]
MLTLASDINDISFRVRSFGSLIVDGQVWDLAHLDPFTFPFELEPDYLVTVVVFFSCHCFTRSFARDGRPRSEISPSEIYDDGREKRVLCQDRYQTSRRLLRDLMSTLATRRITLADERQPNFVTVETMDHLGLSSVYAVFFEVSKAKARKRRLILQVQSAYILEGGLSKRQLAAKKVTLRSILLAAMERRKIRP